MSRVGDKTLSFLSFFFVSVVKQHDFHIYAHIISFRSTLCMFPVFHFCATFPAKIFKIMLVPMNPLKAY